MESALAFAAEAAAATDTNAGREWIVDRLASLVPGDGHFYTVSDTRSSTLLHEVASIAEPADRDAEQLATMLRAENPFCQHFAGRLERGAVRLTDITDPAAFTETALGAFLGWTDRRYAMQLRTPIGPASHCCVDVDRTDRDFTQRETQLVGLLQPHLAAFERGVAVRRELEGYRGASSSAAAERRLTPREREILDLVAAGETNAAIARRLWISPDTVRKHLENTYQKLGVRTRTAALARTGRAGPGRIA